MSKSLAYCLDQNSTGTIESARIILASKTYEAKGFTVKEANLKAVREAIKTLEAERADVVKQIREQVPGWGDVVAKAEAGPDYETIWNSKDNKEQAKLSTAHRRELNAKEKRRFFAKEIRGKKWHELSSDTQDSLKKWISRDEFEKNEEFTVEQRQIDQQGKLVEEDSETQGNKTIFLFSTPKGQGKIKIRDGKKTSDKLYRSFESAEEDFSDMVGRPARKKTARIEPEITPKEGVKPAKTGKTDEIGAKTEREKLKADRKAFAEYERQKNAPEKLEKEKVTESEEKGPEGIGVFFKILGAPRQKFEMIRNMPREEADLPDERYYEIKDVKTGGLQVVEEVDLKPVDEKSEAYLAQPEKTDEIEVEVDGKDKDISVDLTAAEESKITLKEQKEYLLAEIDKAIELAVDAPETGKRVTPIDARRPRDEKEKRQDQKIREEKRQDKIKREKKYGTVTIHVPDDGIFTALNTKQVLRRFKKKAKRFPSATLKAKKASILKKRPLEERLEPLHKIQGGKGFFTDGVVVIKGKPPASAKYGSNFTEYNILEKFLNAETLPADLKFFSVKDVPVDNLITGLKGVTKAPLPASMLGKEFKALAIFQRKDEMLPSRDDLTEKDGVPYGDYVYFDPLRLNAIIKRFPDATYGLNEDDILVAYDKGSPVAVLNKLAGIKFDPELQEMAEKKGFVEKGAQPKYSKTKQKKPFEYKTEEPRAKTEEIVTTGKLDDVTANLSDLPKKKITGVLEQLFGNEETLNDIEGRLVNDETVTDEEKKQLRMADEYMADMERAMIERSEDDIKHLLRKYREARRDPDFREWETPDRDIRSPADILAKRSPDFGSRKTRTKKTEEFVEKASPVSEAWWEIETIETKIVQDFKHELGKKRKNDGGTVKIYDAKTGKLYEALSYSTFAKAEDVYRKMVKEVEPTKFSKTEQKTTPLSTVAQVKKFLVKALGKKKFKNLIESGKVEIVETEADLKSMLGKKGVKFSEDDTVNGMFWHGTTYLVAENLTEQITYPTFLHETIHAERALHGYKGLFGKRHDQIKAQFERMLKEGHAGLLAAQKKAKEAGTSEEHMWEETLAYFVQDSANHKTSLFKRILRAVRAWAVRAGLKKEVTAEDLVALAEAAVRRQAKVIPDGRMAETGLAPLMAQQKSPEWYSRLGKLIDDHPTEKQSAKAWVATLQSWKKKKLSPALQEELEWSGLIESLELMGKQKVTKQYIQNMIEVGGVKVKTEIAGVGVIPAGELEEGQEGRASHADKVLNPAQLQLPDGYYERQDDDYIDVYDLNDELVGSGSTLNEALEESGISIGRSKNYKEIFISLPSEEITGGLGWKEQDELDDLQGILYPTPKQTLREKELIEKEKEYKEDLKTQYTSPHFPEKKNLLVHLRVDERTDSDGNRVLFINEVQSDYAKAARKGVIKKFTIVQKLKTNFPKLPENHTEWSEIKLEKAGVPTDLIEAWWDERMREKVPDAPFVKSDTAWSMLGLKKAIHYAASQGIKKVAWPATAEQVYEIEQWGEVMEEDGRYKNQDGEGDVTAIVQRYLRGLPRDANRFLKFQKTGVTVQKDTLSDNESVNSINISSFAEKVQREGVPLFSMAGKKAKGAPTGALNKAQEMLKAGKDKKEVWRETGWLRGAEKDETWKFEIDDSGAEVDFSALEQTIASHTDQTKLGKFFKHELLFKAYPQLKEYNLFVTTGDVSIDKGCSGSFCAPSNFWIKHGLTDEQTIGILLHETQHAIQDIEGFAEGGTPAAPEWAADSVLNDLKFKLNRLLGLEEYKKNAPAAFRKVTKKLLQDEPFDENSLPEYAYSSFTQENLEDNLNAESVEDFEISNEEIAQMLEKEAVYAENLQVDIQRKTNLKQKIKKAEKEKQEYKEYNQKHYWNLAGEIESRDTEARLKLTAKQRREQMPYESQGIPESQWIVTDGKGTSFSVTEKAPMFSKSPKPKSYQVALEKYQGKQVVQKTDKIKTGQPLADELEKNRTYANQIHTERDLEVMNANRKAVELERQIKILTGTGREKGFIGKKLSSEKTRFSEVKARKLAEAMFLYRDAQINPEQAMEFKRYAIKKLKTVKGGERLQLKEQLAAFEQSQNLTKEQKEFVDDTMDKAFEAVGDKAKSTGIIKKTLDNYVRRIIDTPDNWSGSGKYGFKTFTTASMKRKHDTVFSHFMLGRKLKIKGIVGAYSEIAREVATITANKNFIKASMDIGVLTTNSRQKGYALLNAKGFSAWARKAGAKIKTGMDEPGELQIDTHGRKIFFAPPLIRYGATKIGGKRVSKYFENKEDVQEWVQKKGADKYIIEKVQQADVFEKVSLYAPEQIAAMLNGMTKTSVGMFETPVMKGLLRFNAAIKGWILLSSFFHHMAGQRSWSFGVDHEIASALKKGEFKQAIKNIGTMVNSVSAHKRGLEKIQAGAPELSLLVSQGLTIGEMQDWDESLLREQGGYTETFARKLGAEKITKSIEALRICRETFTNSLFKRYFAGLKAEAAVIEYSLRMKKATQKGEIPDANRIAEKVARLINADFGGLHLSRMGRSKDMQKMLRLLLLAPDWTESNFRTFTGMIPGAHKKVNQLIGDVPAPPGMDKVYRGFWGGIIIKVTLATIMAQAMASLWDDEEDKKWRREEFFKNFKRLKWTGVNVSGIYRSVGIDMDENQRKIFSVVGHFADPLKAMHPEKLIKGKGSPLTRIVGAGMSKTDWRERPYTSFSELMSTGRLKKKSRYEFKENFFEALPSIAADQVINMQPIQVGHILRYLQGEEDGLSALLTSGGAHITTAYKPTDKYVFADRRKKIRNAYRRFLDKGKRKSDIVKLRETIRQYSLDRRKSKERRDIPEIKIKDLRSMGKKYLQEQARP